MTLTDKTKCKFRLEITLQPMRADGYSVFIINTFVLKTVLKDFYFKYMLLKVQTVDSIVQKNIFTCLAIDQDTKKNSGHVCRNILKHAVNVHYYYYY